MGFRWGDFDDSLVDCLRASNFVSSRGHTVGWKGISPPWKLVRLTNLSGPPPRCFKMHAAVHIIPRLFICISSSSLRGDNIDGIPCSINAASNQRCFTRRFSHGGGSPSSIFKIVSSREKRKTTTFPDVEKFDRFRRIEFYIGSNSNRIVYPSEKINF